MSNLLTPLEYAVLCLSVTGETEENLNRQLRKRGSTSQSMPVIIRLISRKLLVEGERKRYWTSRKGIEAVEITLDFFFKLEELMDLMSSGKARSGSEL